jgi:hypothetical protein
MYKHTSILNYMELICLNVILSAIYKETLHIIIHKRFIFKIIYQIKILKNDLYIFIFIFNQIF